MAYLLDSNIFIQAKNLHYGFDFCPAFWGWILQQNASGTPASSPKRIKIPNACLALTVRAITPYEMLRAEKARFVLGV